MASQSIMEQKRTQIEEIKEKFSNAQGMVVVEYQGISVEDDTALRRELRNNDIEYSVLKNRLVQKALNELGKTDYDFALNGTSAFAFSNKDCIVPAKALKDASEKFAKIKIKCGMAEGKFLDEAGVKNIASFGSKENLIAKMLGSMQATITNLAVVLKQISEKEA